MPADPVRHILLTSALPYANGPLHLGHILETIQADIWARFQRLRGHRCHYICADDAHGTAIMLKAEEAGISPEALIAKVQEEHRRDFAGFHIAFDSYYTTHSAENRELSQYIYQRCREGGYIAKRNITQAYDPERKIFLADRFIRGSCPRCRAEDQYGDHCENCGASYSPAELHNPRSALSGKTPVEKESLHYFFQLPAFEKTLREWMTQGALQPQVINKLREWMDAGLQEWDISRDAPYFGFEIPGAPGKYFYVWLDAPVGYMASCQKLCEQEGLDFDIFWHADAKTELHHFIGKDIIHFHGLFWPALLQAAGFRLPTAIHAHGFLTVLGEKMSKSKGTYIRARHFLQQMDPDVLRYYMAARLGSGLEDVDLDPKDMVQRVNADLVGKVVNIASRCAPFLERHFDNVLCGQPDGGPTEEARAAAAEIASCFEAREYSRALRVITGLADSANRFIDEKKPWEMAKADTSNPEIHEVCSIGIATFRLLLLYLKPVVPGLAKRAEAYLGETLHWRTLSDAPAGRRLARFTPLFQRVDPTTAAALVSDKADTTGA